MEKMSNLNSNSDLIITVLEVLDGIHVWKQNDSWTRVEQILDMDDDKFAAEFFRVEMI